MKIVLYQTSDVHGSIYPTNYLTEIDSGFLKIASYIEADQKQYDASLKIDNGDFIQGSAFAQFLSTKENASASLLIQALNTLSYDAYVLGNHEFNYGLDYLKQAYQQVEDKVLSANILGLPFETKPYQLFDFAGFTIGVLGLTTQFIPNWEDEKNIKGITFLDAFETYKKYETELTAQCDLIVVAYHAGFENDFWEDIEAFSESEENQGGALLKNFASIDILLTGHQHQIISQTINDTVVSMPGVNGQYLTKIVIDTETKEINNELIDIATIELSNHPEIEKIFTPIHETFLKYLDEVIGYLPKDIPILDTFNARLHGHPFMNLTHQIQLDVADADISVASLFDNSKGFYQDVTVKDVLLNFPFPNTLKVLRLQGHDIKAAIEKSVTYFDYDGAEIAVNKAFLHPKPLHYNYDLFFGLQYTVNLHKPYLERVISLTRFNEPFDLDDYYKVVLTNYRANNKDIYPMYAAAEVIKEINIEIGEIVMNYFLKNKEITISDEPSIIIKN